MTIYTKQIISICSHLKEEDNNKRCLSVYYTNNCADLAQLFIHRRMFTFLMHPRINHFISLDDLLDFICQNTI